MSYHFIKFTLDEFGTETKVQKKRNTLILKNNAEDLGLNQQKSADPEIQSPAKIDYDEDTNTETEPKSSKWRQEREAFIKAMKISKKIGKLEKDGTLDKDEQAKQIQDL